MHGGKLPEFARKGYDSSVSSPVIVCEPFREPSLIRAGDTVTWERYFPLYEATGGYTLAYTIINRTVTYQVNGGEVVPNGNAFTVTIPAATTANWLPGQYRWQAYISDGNGNRYTVAEGVLEITPNLQVQPAGLDDRELDEKILDAIRDLISGKVLAGDAQKYMIHGRELQRYTFAELKALRSEYALRVREIRIRRGERVPSRTVRSSIRG